MSHFEEQKIKINLIHLLLLINFCSVPPPRTSLPMPFLTFNDVFTYLKKSYDQLCIYQQYFFHIVF